MDRTLDSDSSNAGSIPARRILDMIYLMDKERNGK